LRPTVSLVAAVTTSTYVITENRTTPRTHCLKIAGISRFRSRLCVVLCWTVSALYTYSTSTPGPLRAVDTLIIHVMLSSRAIDRGWCGRRGGDYWLCGRYWCWSVFL